MRKEYLAGIVAGALAGDGLAMLAIYVTGTYGKALFFGVPMVIGFVASAVLRSGGPKRLGESILCTFGAATLASLGFLLLGKEGIVCILLALPLAAPFLLIGALLGYLLLHRGTVPDVPSVTTMIAIMAALIFAESQLRRPESLMIVEDSVLVNASPSRVWASVIALDAVPAPGNWMYRVGLACPERTRIESPRPGGHRVCTLSTGLLVEQIDVWRPEEALGWHSLSSPPPMHELNPFHDHVDAPHLHGYYESPRGEFVLSRIGPNLTRLTRRTWYSVRLYPRSYWSFFCELAISQIHRTVLGQVRYLAEGGMRI